LLNYAAKETQDRLLKIERAIFGIDTPTLPGDHEIESYVRNKLYSYSESLNDAGIIRIIKELYNNKLLEDTLHTSIGNGSSNIAISYFNDIYTELFGDYETEEQFDFISGNANGKFHKLYFYLLNISTLAVPIDPSLSVTIPETVGLNSNIQGNLKIAIPKEKFILETFELPKEKMTISIPMATVPGQWLEDYKIENFKIPNMTAPGQTLTGYQIRNFKIPNMTAPGQTLTGYQIENHKLPDTLVPEQILSEYKISGGSITIPTQKISNTEYEFPNIVIKAGTLVKDHPLPDITIPARNISLSDLIGIITYGNNSYTGSISSINGSIKDVNGTIRTGTITDITIPIPEQTITDLKVDICLSDDLVIPLPYIEIPEQTLSKDNWDLPLPDIEVPAQNIEGSYDTFDLPNLTVAEKTVTGPTITLDIPNLTIAEKTVIGPTITLPLPSLQVQDSYVPEHTIDITLPNKTFSNIKVKEDLIALLKINNIPQSLNGNSYIEFSETLITKDKLNIKFISK
jgi:hypothetical protein